MRAGSFEEVAARSRCARTIARRLVEASRTIPHFYLTADCELDALMSLREAINDAAPKDKEGKPSYKISVNDFIIKALAHGADPRSRRQCDLDRECHAETQTGRCRCRGGHSRRSYHAHRPCGRDKNPVRDFARDEGFFHPRPRPQAAPGRISGRLDVGVQSRHVWHQRAFPPSSIRRKRRSSRWVLASRASSSRMERPPSRQ